MGGKWQSIDSAPKDGTPILGWDGRTMTTVGWHQYHDNPGYWSLVEFGTYAEDSMWEPTHWMPLPEPPRGEK